MKALYTLILFLLACTAYAQSNLPACQGSDLSKWNNCFGTFANQDGNVYIGEYQHGVPNGFGQSLNSAGQKYVGNFKNGVFVGKLEANQPIKYTQVNHPFTFLAFNNPMRATLKGD